MKRSLPCNIAIIPPKNISKRAISISRALAKKRTLFTLDGKNYFPHLTIYMTEFPVKNINVVKDLLKQALNSASSFKINSSGYRNDKSGFIDVNFKRNKSITHLQRKIITVLNPLREGLIRKSDKEKFKQLSKAEKRNLMLCGYRSISSNYSPHLTLTRFKEFDKNAISGIKKYDFSFHVKEIGFFKSGKHGACRKLLAKFKLS